ncbi:Helix-turn-helix domain protein [Tepidanaerobacter acetatoxydans Re1]|uniref:Helix-turn-helix domain protein n=1 Tax=Tepidanaerobacter acetatoxydans (strain DSM 21804 / JCM 16047 / Re1) TaxID=1209989 RepID=F4LRV2_TEPAE|nr:helix-turn-helix transcriptional regulator [Tepidanaerobacter acetatoxydans]AEE91170.1 helix-turn-helix domain protein [Tepidanaerobacter acetatoxydans Re1]CCP25841.1 Helix-turn-helix domain protein [Tepidanaerobacter acetatoxydans Re1]
MGKRRNRLAMLRNSKGLTQRDLANELGVSPSTIAMYEIGERTPGLKMAKIIADFFGVGIEYIFFTAGAYEKEAKIRDSQHDANIA